MNSKLVMEAWYLYLKTLNSECVFDSALGVWRLSGRPYLTEKAYSRYQRRLNAWEQTSVNYPIIIWAEKRLLCERRKIRNKRRRISRSTLRRETDKSSTYKK